MFVLIHTHTHTHTHIYIYIYIYTLSYTLVKNAELFSDQAGDIYIVWMKNARSNLPKMNLDHNTRKRAYINICLLKRRRRAAAF